MLSEHLYSRLPIGSHRFKHYCKPDNPKKPLSATVTADGAVWHCHRCGESGSLHGERSKPRRILTTSPTTTSATRRTFLSDFGRDIWSACESLSGDATEYLQARHCVIPP